MATQIDYTGKIAEAVRALIARHGQPNGFTCTDIAHASGLSPMKVGRILSAERGPYCVWQKLGGAEKFGSCPVYADRRLRV